MLLWFQKRGQWPINLCLGNYAVMLNFKYFKLIEESGCNCQIKWNINYSFVIDDNRKESIKTIDSSVHSKLTKNNISFCFTSFIFRFLFLSHSDTRCTQITAFSRWQFTWISSKFDTNNTIAMAKWSHNQTAQWPNDKWCGYSYTKTDSHSIGWHLFSHQNNTNKPCKTVEHYSQNLVSNGPWTGKKISNEKILVGFPQSLVFTSFWKIILCATEEEKRSSVTLYTVRFG